MPARSMSAIRASMSKQPGRISSKRAGSMLHSSRGRPDHGVQPDVGVAVPLEDPALRRRRRPRRPRGAPPCSAAGRRPSKRSGGSMRWSSTEMTGTRIGRGLGVGQQRRPVLRLLRLDGSHEKVTLSSAKSAGPGGAHDHTRRGRHHGRRPPHRRRRGARRRRDLPGDEPGAAGRGGPRRPGHQPGAARPGRGRGAPVPAGLGRAGRWTSGRPRSSRRPRPAWPPSRRTTWPACSPASTARPTWRRSSTPPPWPAWPRPSRRSWPRRSPPREVSGGGDPDRVGAARGGRRHPALQLARLGHGQQGAAGAAGRQHGRGEGAADVPGDGAAGGRRHGRGAARRACSTS